MLAFLLTTCSVFFANFHRERLDYLFAEYDYVCRNLYDRRRHEGAERTIRLLGPSTTMVLLAGTVGIVVSLVATLRIFGMEIERQITLEKRGSTGYAENAGGIRRLWPWVMPIAFGVLTNVGLFWISEKFWVGGLCGWLLERFS